MSQINVVAKAGGLDHIWWVILPLTYKTKQQLFNSTLKGGQSITDNYGQGYWRFHKSNTY
jgi:hypothetical protein